MVARQQEVRGILEACELALPSQEHRLLVATHPWSLPVLCAMIILPDLVVG